MHLLDLPGFGHRSTARLPAALASVSAATAAWLAQVPVAPVLLLGHSTGAQAALRAALVQPAAVHRLVLAGATFPPGVRRPFRLAGRVLRTLVHERPGGLPAALPYYVRGRRGLPTLLRTGFADRPEDAVTALVPPLLVLRGEADRLCPQDWAEALGQGARDGGVAVVPGAHNHPWTHPEQTARVLRNAARSAI